VHDVIIIGAGPAGISAALWCDQLGLDTLVLEQSAEIGGQLLSVYNPIENYLGLKAKDGRELRDLFAAQVEDSEFDLWTETAIVSVDLRAKTVTLQSGEQPRAIAVIIATGVRRRRLGYPVKQSWLATGSWSQPREIATSMLGRTSASLAEATRL
jgi:thioredoxin reductase (NADPH)